MLARISGTLEGIEGGTALVAVGESGLVLEAMVPTTLAEDLLERVGEPVTLHTQMYIEAHAQGASMTPRLLGFASASDRRFFQLFTTVKGVGPRKALRALAAPIPVIAQSIAEGDVKALQRLPEIGKKTAETIVHELREKVAAHAASGVVEAKTGASGAHGPAAQQTIEALVRLGESRGDAERLVSAALAADSSLSTPDALLAAAFGMKD